ncbi:MAG: helix-turn-helix domain-containing protein [Microbacterium sp.]
MSGSLSRLLRTHLARDTHESGLVSARRFRNLTVTSHVVHEEPWACGGPTHGLTVFPRGGHGLPDAGGHPPVGVFLPPGGMLPLIWDDPTDVLCIWAHGEALAEFSGGLPTEPVLLRRSPLVMAFRAFAQSVSRQPDEGSSVSRYAIERLLAEMIFGTALEELSAEAPDRSPASLVDRARSTMLLHREDATFTIAELANELYVSMRQLQRAFARIDTTPGDVLRGMRLELAGSLLHNPQYLPLSVDEIAKYAGFQSALQLRRALSAAGLPPPREQRRAAQAAAAGH